jgi:hypothetical protein
VNQQAGVGSGALTATRASTLVAQQREVGADSAADNVSTDVQAGDHRLQFSIATRRVIPVKCAVSRVGRLVSEKNVCDMTTVQGDTGTT